MLNKYFKNIYCINLEHRKDRWDKVSEEFKKFGIENVNKFNAVDGNKLDYSLMTYNPLLLKGEIGVLFSHIKLIKMAKEQNLENILILEDDVCFTNELNRLDFYMEQVPENWDLLYLGANHMMSDRLIQIKPNIVKLNHSFGLQCVAVKNTIYDRILELSLKLGKQVDVYYTDIQKESNVYCLHPNIALQEQGFSDIQNKNVNYDNFFKNF